MPNEINIFTNGTKLNIPLSVWFVLYHVLYEKGQVVSVHAKKAYGGLEIQVNSIITSGLDGDQQSASSPERFTAGETDAIAIIQEAWMGPITDPDAYKTQISCSCRVSKQGFSMFSNRF